MNSLKGILIAASITAFSLPALADEQNTDKLEGIDTSLCLDEPLVLEGESAEDIASWMQMIGLAFNMQVKIFMSAKDPGLKFIVSNDPYYGLFLRMHKGDSSCLVSPDTFMSFTPIEFKPQIQRSA